MDGKVVWWWKFEQFGFGGLFLGFVGDLFWVYGESFGNYAMGSVTLAGSVRAGLIRNLAEPNFSPLWGSLRLSAPLARL